MITKNHLVTRDIDLFRELAQFNAVRINISITTLDTDFLSPLINLMWVALCLLAAWCIGRPYASRARAIWPTWISSVPA